MQSQRKEFLFVGYSKYSKGYKLVILSTQKGFIERSVEFQEEPLAVVEVGESSSLPKPLNVSEETNQFAESDMSDNNDSISYPNSPTIPKWVASTIHAAGELAGNSNDTGGLDLNLSVPFV